ncbi:hypothetical protein Back11_31930 [Paenibacillus baekrokdamisoli]|uniref:Uncharacterized protein n=1 Tax=Paenibacillus baekrokdamisoli TaxID=1712516 RepID=A0A3G9JD19_9BACL|nr:Calx-beta domain-containing protein [Paenibacillus baekrokdamisoli]MBB3071642.1 hypothetical protein [Paenibacillus baekrokdamisoli]BBH21848.1 hypothetical protein Back11_31930 [Paenibacillus baekrokdamisoli]
MNLKDSVRLGSDKLRMVIIVMISIVLVFTLQGAASAKGKGITYNKHGVIVMHKELYHVKEGQRYAAVTVERLGGSMGNVTVDYCLCDLTAKKGSDFLGSSGTIAFRNGERTKRIQLKIIDDQIIEGMETFRVKLMNPKGGAVIGKPGEAIVEIIDNDNNVVVA